MTHKPQPLSLFHLRRLILFFTLLIGANIGFAQQQEIDSILVLIKKHPQQDTLKVTLLNDLAYSYHIVYPDSTTILAKQSFELSKEIGYQKGKGDALKVWAIGSYLISEYEDAILKNEKALEIFESIGDLKGCGAVLNNIAIIRHNQGIFDEALDYYQRSLDIRIKINDLIGVGACYNNMGNTYSDKGNYSEALFYLFKGLRIREKINTQQGIANSLSNIANIYFYLGKYAASLTYSNRALLIQESIGNKDGVIQALVAIGAVYHIQKKNEESLKCFQKAIKMAEEMGNTHSVALCLNNIGDEYVSQERYAEAKPYYEKSLALSEKSGDQESIAICNNGIGLVLLHSNEPRKAVEHLLLSYNTGSGIGAKLIALEASNNLALAYEKLGDPKNTAFYLKKFIAYKDSLFNDEVTKKAEQLEFNFILDKKQKEIAILEKDKSIQQGVTDRTHLINVSLAAVLFLIMVFTVSLFMSSRKVKQANKLTNKQKEEIARQANELQALNQLKDKILSVLSHDLRGPIASLSGILTLLDFDSLSPQEFTQVKQGMNDRLSALNLLLDNLLYWSRSQLNGNKAINKTEVFMVKAIEQNIKLLNEYALQKNISLRLHVNDNRNVAAIADPSHVDIILRNLISNAVKFTHPNGHIEISIAQTDKTVTVQITDDGVGMDDTVKSKLFSNTQTSNYGTIGEKGTGFGLFLCKDFVDMNGGEISVTSQLGKGSSFGLTLPKA
jgi:signal transduction histidine kinase/TPR repeat protein